MSPSICKRRDFLRSAVALGAVLPCVGKASSAEPSASSGLVFSKRLPVRVETDVFVAGGGPAGVAAAVTAARAGAKVFLAEAHTCFGGMGTAGRIPLFMTWGDGIRNLAAGFGERVKNRLSAESHLRGPATDIEALKRVYDAEAAEAGLDFVFYSRVIDVAVRDGRVDHVVCVAPSGLWAVRARVYVDATGNGDLCAFAGATTKTGDEQGVTMPGTVCTLWSGVDFAKARGRHSRFLADAIRDGVFTTPDLNWAGIWDVGEGIANGNLGHAFGLDGTDERSLTKALVEGRRQAVEYERYLREYLKDDGCGNARLVATADLVGIRASRRVIGDYVLTLDDYLKRASFADEIGRYSYVIDIHPAKKESASHTSVSRFYDRYHGKLGYVTGDSYGIPYRTLVPKDLSNVLVAGRCISCDHHVQGSVRATPGCYITGQAAGMAAAMAVPLQGEVRRVAADSLRNRLRGVGAYVPDVRA